MMDTPDMHQHYHYDPSQIKPTHVIAYARTNKKPIIWYTKNLVKLSVNYFYKTMHTLGDQQKAFIASRGEMKNTSRKRCLFDNNLPTPVDCDAMMGLVPKVTRLTN